MLQAAFIALLASFANANQELMFPTARALSSETFDMTEFFAPSYSDAGAEPSATTIAGIAVGFSLGGLFVLISFIMMIRSEINTHADYNRRLEEKVKELTDEYNVSQEEIDYWY